MSNEHMPAFPACNEANNNGTMGLTKREYMATALMPCIIVATCAGQHHSKKDDSIRLSMAKDAVELADALIAALGGE